MVFHSKWCISSWRVREFNLGIESAESYCRSGLFG